MLTVGSCAAQLVSYSAPDAFPHLPTSFFDTNTPILCGAKPRPSFCTLDRVQQKAIRLISDSSSTSNRQTLAHPWGVVSPFYRYDFAFFCFKPALAASIQADSHLYQVFNPRCRTSSFQPFISRTAKLRNIFFRLPNKLQPLLVKAESTRQMLLECSPLASSFIVSFDHTVYRFIVTHFV